MAKRLSHIDIKIFWDGLLNSYSQIFFSNNKGFALVLLLVSFVDLGAGLSGVLSVLTAQATIVLFSFNKESLRTGSLTYNVLLVGLALGSFYNFTLSSFILLLIISVLTLFATVWIAGWLESKSLPFLSIPFLIGIWIILLGAPNFTTIQLVEKESLSLSRWFPEVFAWVSSFVGSMPMNNALHLYFRSLGAILFQYNDLAGIIIALGILLYSRIAFGLSLFGFFIGYAFYVYFEGDFSQLIYSYIGFNFILTSIALGGFFVVPSSKSYLMLLFTIPVIAMLISALHTLFSIIYLPMYSLPFNIVTLLFLVAMMNRRKSSGINLVSMQQFSPEKNHYWYKGAANRLRESSYLPLSLPVLGQWRVSQGHNGQITHKDDWQYAWDFDVVDESGKTYQGSGTLIEDYYCYKLPVLASADGYVVDILDGVEDNEIKQVNLKENWGNTIIIKHADFLYSKLSHLQKGSFQVQVGDFVKQGQQLAFCGSSGRSPEPHLHFQLQSTAHIGSKTLEYPLSYYLRHENGQSAFHSFSIPEEQEQVSNVLKTKLLSEAFNFIPGKKLAFELDGESYVFEVLVNVYNKPYLYCKATDSIAYFENNGTVFQFTYFYGKKSSLLYHLYCGAHKVLLTYYDGVSITEDMPLLGFFNPVIKAIHDFTAPFFHYCKLKFEFKFQSIDAPHNPKHISFRSSCTGFLASRKLKKNSYQFELKNERIETFHINQEQIAKCIDL